MKGIVTIFVNDKKFQAIRDADLQEWKVKLVVRVPVLYLENTEGVMGEYSMPVIFKSFNEGGTVPFGEIYCYVPDLICNKVFLNT